LGTGRYFGEYCLLSGAVYGKCEVEQKLNCDWLRDMRKLAGVALCDRSCFFGNYLEEFLAAMFEYPG